ncbi:hypothetical protein AMATHDRAFT_63710 [Amanita thiersii Skay4041]|uniref:Uncharacterized protein n=1 Tax=Amanita thiersii Skay4041 TaxID=703135 RepID=A0A2A9NEU6_9AGAR|nr:hypothetical protein AMATHDRAFT_63710 [Amanita thiersii Skay4041]
MEKGREVHSIEYRFNERGQDISADERIHQGGRKAGSQRKRTSRPSLYYLNSACHNLIVTVSIHDACHNK